MCCVLKKVNRQTNKMSGDKQRIRLKPNKTKKYIYWEADERMVTGVLMDNGTQVRHKLEAGTAEDI